jgi:hypothetical protein
MALLFIFDRHHLAAKLAELHGASKESTARVE